MPSKNVSRPSRPTDGELAILNVLWEKKAATVKEVQEALDTKRDEAVGYTTVLKLMQIMLEKGLVKRDESARAHVFRAAAPPDRTQRQMVGDFMDRVFQGSALALVQQALGARKVSAAELKQIRELIQTLENK